MLSEVKRGTSNVAIIVTMVAIVAVVYIALLFYVEPIVFNKGTTYEAFIALDQLWLLLATVYIAASFRFWQKLGPDDIALRQLFGKPAGELYAGLPLAPPFLYSLVVFKRVILQKEFPAEPEDIYRGEMKDPSNLPEGKKPPIRQSFRTSISDADARKFFGDGKVGPADKLYSVENPHKKDDMITFNYKVPGDGLSKKRVTAELYPVMRWRIHHVTNFVANIGSETTVEKQVEDEIFSVLNRICQQISLAQAFQNQQWLNAILFHAVAARIKAEQQADGSWVSDEWGILLESIFIKYPHLSHGLNSAIADASKATFTAQETVTLAGAEKTKLEKEGAGAAKAAAALAEAELKGFGDGLKHAAELTGLTPAEIAAVKVAQQAADGGNTIILGADGMEKLVGLAAAAGKGLGSQKGNDK